MAHIECYTFTTLKRTQTFTSVGHDACNTDMMGSILKEVHILIKYKV